MSVITNNISTMVYIPSTILLWCLYSVKAAVVLVTPAIT